jgi:hypothetical protein
MNQSKKILNYVWLKEIIKKLTPRSVSADMARKYSEQFKNFKL